MVPALCWDRAESETKMMLGHSFDGICSNAEMRAPWFMYWRPVRSFNPVELLIKVAVLGRENDKLGFGHPLIMFMRYLGPVILLLERGQKPLKGPTWVTKALS
jgi:hypothetical protein